ncbi:hypothetical protein NGTWS0302_14280 [Mycolicibacterium cyprinidarum]|uniref:SF3 helicase domain-containing protein n=1 Tax=Mycolicibacterium cyprinidarum TaxID=2860311 RepID=A0ABQ4V4K4_9MYCO|nr:hypothetical protein NGTWS1702_04100 [Mycolicibacterium sp. NGTWSNA01]GJF17492.1 hypothetical protein NGTWS0302_14280 [Mycolicibacterium sp. NGTWS0302]
MKPHPAETSQSDTGGTPLDHTTWTPVTDSEPRPLPAPVAPQVTALTATPRPVQESNSPIAGIVPDNPVAKPKQKPKPKPKQKPAAAAPTTPELAPEPAPPQLPAQEPAPAIPEFDLAAATAAVAAFCDGLGGPGDRVVVAFLASGRSWGEACARSEVPARVAAQLAADPAVNIHMSVNTVHPDATRRRREDISTLSHLALDVDIKADACADDAQAREVITAVAVAVGAVPVRVTHSGHGWQAWWAVTDGQIGGGALPDTAAADAVSKRFQALANHVAPAGVTLDGVGDLSRIMRIPGTWNIKNPESPVQACGWQAVPDTAGTWTVEGFVSGAPSLTVAAVHAAADRAGIAPPETNNERVESDVKSQELTDEIDAVSWELWLDGDPRLTLTGEIDSCGCPIWHWTGAENSKSATLHEGCNQGCGVHIWSGSMIGQLELNRDHLSRLDLSVALTGLTRREAAARVGITLGGGEPLAAVLPEHYEQHACAAEAAGQADRAAQFREAASGMRAQQALFPAGAAAGQPEIHGQSPIIGGIPTPPAIGAAGGAAAIVDGLPGVDPQLPRYVARAEAELSAASFEVDWNVPPSSLIPRDLRPLREAVTGPRASDRPVVVPARDAAVAQAIAKAVGGSKLLRDVARSTRAAQANLSWDGARWINDADAAAVCVDALVSTHMFDVNPAVRQNKLIVLGFRKPTEEEETMQREDALNAATARGEVFDLAEYVPEQVPFHDQKWCDAATRADALARIVGRQPEVAITDTAAFDADPRLLAAEGGYIRLGKVAEEAVTVTAPDPAALATKMLGARYDAAATCPQWDRFLVQVLPDEELRAFLQRAVGVALLGAVRAQILLALTGDGANGKGVVTNVLLKMLGDYGVALDSRVLTAKSEGDHPAQLMPLRGARVAVVDELPEGLMWAENLIKRLTGGSKVTARWMNENPQSWDPTHTIILTTNGHPLVPPGAKAFWRRYREIPFTQSFATTADEFATGAYAGMADDGLEGRLITELPGILIWALEGYRQYLVRGLDEPAAVIAAGRAARADSSSFAAFCSRMFTATGVEADVVRVQQAWDAWTHYRISGDGHYQRPTNPRDLPTMLVKELGRRTRYIHSTGGKTPARLVGVKWSAEGEALLVEREGPRGAFSPPRLGVVHPPAATA